MSWQSGFYFGSVLTAIPLTVSLAWRAWKQRAVPGSLYAIERKRFEQRLEYLASHDGLTGLPNRRSFQAWLGNALEHARRKLGSGEDHHLTVVMLLDLDNFKDINDTLGHAQGDKLLCLVADRLQGSLRKSDATARRGGDEFTIICEDIDDPKGCTTVARKSCTTYLNRSNWRRRRCGRQPLSGSACFQSMVAIPKLC
jgi:diguanylate cyclase (GGDEF)-like protein